MYRQLWVAIMVSTLLSLGCGLLVSLLSARGYLESQLALKNADNATTLALSLSLTPSDATLIELAVTSLFDGGHYEWVRVTDAAGKVIIEKSSRWGESDAPGWFAAVLPIQSIPGRAQISNGWQQMGTITLASHSRFAYDALWKSAYEMTIVLTLVGVLGGFLAVLVLRRLREPLNAVIGQANAISQRRFVTIAEPKVPELKQLASAMNTTVLRLKSMFDEEAGRLDAMSREANRDALTGLANRNHFMARLGECLGSEDAVGGSLLLVRLPDLDTLNQKFGRQWTDDYLKHTAQSIYQCCAGYNDGVGARLNGSDFGLMLPAEDDCLHCAQSLFSALQKTGDLPMEDAGVFIGGTRFESGMDIGALLARTDRALASAQVGQGVAVHDVHVDDAHLPQTAEQWSKSIRQALESAFVCLVSFPVVSLSKQLLHHECLFRLKVDGKGEWLPAARFLPVAERLGLAAAIDLCALELGLQELHSHPHLQGLALNLSVSSVADPAFRRQLFDLLLKHRLVLPRLWIEVGASGALKHLAAFRDLCRGLKSLDCRVGLEHFGYNLDQIALLHDLGLDYLKIDASFIRGIDSHVRHQEILKGLCSVTHKMGLTVIAEGVTTHAELHALNALGFGGATGTAVLDPDKT